jgi:Domain of Unknown Function (DUF1080)
MACDVPHHRMPGYAMAFDGTRKSLRAWRQAGPGGFTLTPACTLRSHGGLGLLWWTHRLRRPYTVRATWRLRGDFNSGVFVGFPASDDPQTAITRGYEVQIDPSDDADSTTGAIYNVKAPNAARRDRALRPGWNTFTINVGRRIIVRLNGTIVTRFLQPLPSRARGGHIGLQNHSPADTVEFRSVQIR